MPTVNRSGNGNTQRNMQIRREPPGGARTGEETRREEPSPIVSMCKHIRDRQGENGLRDFLAAMEPFAAPNELRSIASGYGIDYDELRESRRARPENAANQGGRQGGMNGGFGFDPQMLQMMQLMQFMNGMGGGPKSPGGPGGMGNPMQLMQLMPMLRAMTGGGAPGGGGTPDIAALMKMMGG